MDPIVKFMQWLDEAKKHKTIPEPTAGCLATAETGGQPSARMVLLKRIDERGLVFYTHLDSCKSRELKENPKAAFCFYWGPLQKQVRVEGGVEPVSAAEADAYFATRPRESRISAWASKQSCPLSGRDELMSAVAECETKFAGKDIPRPPFWSGWRLIPSSIEFWQQGDSRLHDREVFTRKGKGWEVRKLYP